MRRLLVFFIMGFPFDRRPVARGLGTPTLGAATVVTGADGLADAVEDPRFGRLRRTGLAHGKPCLGRLFLHGGVHHRSTGRERDHLCGPPFGSGVSLAVGVIEHKGSAVDLDGYVTAPDLLDGALREGFRVLFKGPQGRWKPAFPFRPDNRAALIRILTSALVRELAIFRGLPRLRA